MTKKQEKMKKRCLNLGCGKNYKESNDKEEWINVDLGLENNLGKKIKVDVIHDLDKFPYPFHSNTFDFILLNQVLEHLDRPEKVMKELIRIAKNNAIIVIRVPHFSDYKAYSEPTHRHYFALNSIDFMNYNCEIIEKKFEISNNPLVWLIGKIFTLSPFIYERFLHGYFPVQGIKWKLKVRK